MPLVLTDGEFVELWKKHGGANEMARAVGMHVRNIKARRRRLEARYGAELEAVNRPQVAQYYKHLTPAQHSARKHLEVGDGQVIVFSDAHFWPGVRTTAFRALLMFCANIKPRAVVCNGDAFDGASISRFPRIGWDSKPSVIEELKACKDSLELIQDAAKGARLYWPLGNHDARFENRLAQNAPEFQGVGGFHLKDHFPDWEPCWSLWVNGDTVIKHRAKGGIHATRNNALNAGKTVVTGHLHSLKVTPMTDYNGDRWGVDTGTLADPTGPQFVDYLEDGCTDWRSGFIVLTYRKGRLLWPEVAHVISQTEVTFRDQIITV